MSFLVMKFGGTSVADVDHIKTAAEKITRELANGHKIIVVVSAMSGKTNQLIGWVKETQTANAAEFDAIVSSGENITAGLMALCLQNMGVQARSWQGWQVPIETSDAHSAARIENIPRDRLQVAFDSGDQVAVIAGFQGVTKDGRISTLGRGGSDTTAVAFAAAWGAVRCDIYTDVDGIYTTDPRIVQTARKMRKISYEEMLELASLGAKVLQTRSVELAMRYQTPIRVLSSFGHDISPNAGTLVCAEDNTMENKTVHGIAFSKEEAKITLLSVADKPGIAAAIFGTLARAGINVDMIVQNISLDGRTDMTFSCPMEQMQAAVSALSKAASDGLQFDDLHTDAEVAKVSMVGVGMRSHSGIAAQMFQVLADHGINILVITTSEIKVSVLIRRDMMEKAVRALHESFELEKVRD